MVNGNLFFQKYQTAQVFSQTAPLLLSLSLRKAGHLPRVHRTQLMHMHEILLESYWPTFIIKISWVRTLQLKYVLKFLFVMFSKTHIQSVAMALEVGLPDSIEVQEEYHQMGEIHMKQPT